MRRVLASLIAVILAWGVAPVPADVRASSEQGPAPRAESSPPGPAAPIPSGALGYWRFDETAGSTAKDVSGSGLDGSISGATRVEGVSGAALHFDGTDDRVIVPQNLVLEPSQVTLAAWVRAGVVPGSWRTIAFKGVRNCLGSSYILKASATGGLVFGIYDGTTNAFSPDAGTAIWDGEWHLAAGTFDGSAVRLYVDGQLVGATATTISIGYSLPDGNDFVIGHPMPAAACPTPTQFTGDIDEVRVWGRALGLSDIQALLPPFPSTTVLASSPNPSIQGATTELSATVRPSTAKGTVTFTDVTGGETTVLGSGELSSGTATISTSFETLGTRTLVASYGGSADYDPSASSTLNHRVLAEGLIPTATTLAVAPNPVIAGASTTFTATVVPIPTAGEIEWLVDGTPSGTTPLGPDGTASTTRSFPTAGLHEIRAHFVEGTLYADSLSDTTTVTVSPVAYAVTLSAVPPVVVANSTTHLTASVSPPTAGTIKFYRQGSPDQLLASLPLAAGGQAVLDPVVPWGTSIFRADFIPTGATAVAGSATTVVQGKDGTTVSLAANRDTAVSGETLVTFTASLGDWDATGTVTFRDVTSSTPKVLGTATVVGDDYDDLSATLKVRLSGTGIRAIDAVYGGNTTYAPATSNLVAITLTPDVGVSASGVGVSAATFYPYKDGYKDTVAIRGTPGEPVSVSVKVYNASGRKVRSWSLATRSSPWSIAWNGRTASGSRLPAGKYKVVQTLRDVPGHTKTFTAYTTISSKRLTWYTASITKNGISVSNFYEGYAGWIRPSSRYSRGLEVSYFAWAGYRFAMKSAVKYGKLTFSVLGSPRPGWGVAYISLWNDAYGYDDGVRYVGRSYAWYGTSVAAGGHVFSSNRVHAFVTASTGNYGWYDVAKVRLTYRYARLE